MKKIKLKKNEVLCPDGLVRRFDITSKEDKRTGRVRFQNKSVSGFNIKGLFVPNVVMANGNAFQYYGGSPIKVK